MVHSELSIHLSEFSDCSVKIKYICTVRVANHVQVMDDLKWWWQEL